MEYTEIQILAYKLFCDDINETLKDNDIRNDVSKFVNLKVFLNDPFYNMYYLEKATNILKK